METYLYSDITEKIIRAYYNVYNKLGYGFLEKVYEKSMIIELRRLGLQCMNQLPVKVYYEKTEVGFYIADIIAEEKVIIEIKAAETLSDAHEAQLTNYLRATETEVGILLNFGKKPAFKRKVLTAKFKS